MPGVASPLSMVKKLSLRTSSSERREGTERIVSSLADGHLEKPSSIRLVTPTGKSSSSPTTGIQFQLTEKSAKTYILNPQQSSTTTPPSTSSSSLLTLIPPGTSSPKIQTLNSVTNELSSSKASTPPLFLAKNRVTLVQPLINTPSATSITHNGKTSNPPKLLIQQNNHPSGPNTSFWPPPQATKICKCSERADFSSSPLSSSSSSFYSSHW